MTWNQHEVAAQILKAKMNAEIKASKVMRTAIIMTGSQIIAGMPVVSGRLRANWQTTINNQASGALDSTDQSAAISSLTQSITNYNIKDVAYFTNNLPYAQFIEYGDYVGQGKQGTVRQAVAEFSQKIDQALKINK